MKVINRKFPDQITLKTGDIILFAPHDFIGECIAKIDKTPYSHVEVIIICWGIPMSAGSRINGVNLFSIEKALKGRFIEIKRIDDSFDSKNFSLKAAECFGKPYDFEGTFLNQLWYHITGKWTGKRGDSAKRALYCSEFVALIYNKILGKNYFPEWWLTDPKTIYEDRRFKTIWKGQVDEDNVKFL